MTSKNTKITRSYTMGKKVVDLLDIIREEQGVSASWIVNKAVLEYINRNYNIE